MPDIGGMVYLAFAWTEDDRAHMADVLFMNARREYEDALRAELRAAGCDDSGVYLREEEQLSRLKERAEWASQSIARTYNSDLTRIVNKVERDWIDEHGSTWGLNRNTYAARVRDALDDRQLWKATQISVTENTVTTDAAVLSFAKLNGLGEAKARVVPFGAVCSVCQAYIDAGWVALQYAEAHFLLPAHPNCVAAGCRVLTAEGLEKPIEDVRPGDQIYGEGGVPRQVFAVTAWPRQTRELVVLKIRGREVRLTGEHPVLIDGLGWIPAQDVEAGMVVLGLSKIFDARGSARKG